MYKKVIILIKLLFLVMYNMSAQEADSLKYYEHEPAYITTKKDRMNYTTLNYFSKNRFISIGGLAFPIKGGGVYPIGALGDSSNNFGVKIKIKKNNNSLFIKDAAFLIHQLDTHNIMNAKFYVLIENGTNQIKKIELNSQQISLTKHRFYEDNLGNFNRDINQVFLVNITFTLAEISYDKNDELYFMKEDDNPLYYPFSSMIFVTSKKDKSYYYKNEKIYPVDIHQFIPEMNRNALWQVRLKYCEYNKE